MKSNVSLLLLALPLWLASCGPSMDLIGERSTETDEFYLMGGEAHVGDMAIEAARQQMLLDQYDEYMAGEYDDPYGSQYINAPHTRSQLWNRYTPGWSGGFNSGWGSGFGYSPFGYSAFNSPYGFGSPFGFGNQYGFGFGSSGYSPFNQPHGMTTYGWGNQAFMNGYDAWGNPIGWGNPFNTGFAGNGWGYDPWGGGYWGTPGWGYWGNGYHPYFGNMGGSGGWCGTATSGEGDSTPLISPRPRPSFGQFNGYAGNGGNSGSASDGQSGGTDVGTDAPKPNSNRGQAGKRSSTRNRGVITLPANDTREPDYGRQSPDRSGEQNTRPNPNRSNRNSGRSNGGWNSTPRNDVSPPAPRGGGGSARPSAPRPSSPRPSAPRSGGGRSGRGG
ncbi:MAG: hypothetical protein VXY61_03410 [Bacteroidota bacterium]|nr:hypothetical protein [Bacteroidota bacterium]